MPFKIRLPDREYKPILVISCTDRKQSPTARPFLIHSFARVSGVITHKSLYSRVIAQDVFCFDVR